MSKKTLVVGASENPQRYSNKAVKMLSQFGHPITAFGSRNGLIENYPIIKDFPENNNFDTITLYVGPENQTDLMDKIIALKPKRIIFNPGTENAIFEKKANAAGIETENACTLVLLQTGQY
jgi:predicted CoA-binding protein